MLNSHQYSTMRSIVDPLLDHSLFSTSHSDYMNYANLWLKYIDNVAMVLGSRKKGVHRIGVIAMESAPGGHSHPHPRFIFDAGSRGLSSDPYLVNILNGAFGGPAEGTHKGLTRNDGLEKLLNAKDGCGKDRPIVLLDALPTDGIVLNKKARIALTSRVSPEVMFEVDWKLAVIEKEVLVPLGLKWVDVSLTFACPPSTVSGVSKLPSFFGKLGGPKVYPGTLNKGPNTVPTASNLHGLIIGHGF